MDNYTPAEDGAATTERDDLVSDVDDCLSALGLDVAQVTDMALLVLGCAVGAVERVVVAAGGVAAAGEVAKGVNVEAVQAVCETRDLAGEVDFVAALLLGQGDVAGYGVVGGREGDEGLCVSASVCERL